MKARWKFLDIKTDKRQIDMERVVHLQRPVQKGSLSRMSHTASAVS